MRNGRLKPTHGHTFEAATVKLAAPDAVRIVVTSPPASPNRLYIPSMTLADADLFRVR